MSEKGLAFACRKPTEHKASHDGVDDALRGRWKELIILARAAPAPDPAERSFDDPAAREHLEAPRHLWRFLTWRHPTPAARPAHHLDRPAQRLLHPVLEAALIRRVHPQMPQAGQRLSSIRDRFEQTLAARPVG